MNNNNAAVTAASNIPAGGHAGRFASRVALAAALLLTVAAPVVASAAPTSYGSIELRSARVDPPQNETDLEYSEFPFNTVPHVLRVSYVNHSNVTATDVSFELTGLGRTGLDDQVVHDVGTFSPNVVIDKQFWNVGHGGDTVQIVAVKYADGTSWSAGIEPRRQAAEE